MDLEGLLLKRRTAAQGESPLVRARRSTNTSVAVQQASSGAGGPSPPSGSSPLWAPRGSQSIQQAAASGASVIAKYHDIFRDPRVKRWSMSDKALYVVWWSFRPSFCKECGVTDLWTPSPEDEYRCGHCGAGAGTTAQSDNVEEFGGGGGEDADDDSDGEQQQEAGESGDPTASFTASGLYHFFLSWMMALPKALLETNLPRGQDVPLVLRTAYELSLVVALPSMPPSGVYLVRGASLFLGLAAHGFNVPFPVFVRGGTSHAVQQHRIVAAASEKTLMQSSGLLAVASRSEALQWLDVESVAAQVGLTLPDFFESTTASEQYLQNTLTLLAEDGVRVPSLLWRLDRVPGRLELIASMKASLSSESMSPEHRAAVVAIELSRQLELSDINPFSPSATSPDQLRVRDWYDSMLRAEEFAPILQSTTRSCVGGGQGNNSALFPSSSIPAALDGSTALLPDSKLADLLLKLFAFSFRIPRLAMCEMVMLSGCYSGATNFYTLLQEAASVGRFDVLPLFRRLSPLACSPWYVVHSALHSEDRLPLLAALGHVATATVREREAAAGKLVQRICRKHGSNSKYLFNYCLRCVDPEEKHMHGLYVCTYVSSVCSVFTCIRSGRKTITYHVATNTISLCYLGSKERVIDSNRLAVLWVGPMTASVESHTAKFVMDCSRSGLHLSEWSLALQKLHVCSALRKASRTSPFPTHCLSTIRDLLSSASALADNTSDAQLSGSGGAYAFSEAVVARQVGRDVFSLVHPSLLRGCSDDKVLRWYHSLFALAEVRSEVFLPTVQQGGDVMDATSAVTPAQFQSRIFGGPGRAKHRLEDAEACVEDLLRCVKAVKSGVRADISEEVRKRSMRKRRREEELKTVVFDKEDDDH